MEEKICDECYQTSKIQDCCNCTTSVCAKCSLSCSICCRIICVPCCEDCPNLMKRTIFLKQNGKVKLLQHRCFYCQDFS